MHTTDFRTDFTTDTALRPAHGRACRCAFHGRRWFTGGLLATGALASLPAQALLDGCQVSSVAKFVPAEQLERAAQQQYAQLRQEASNQRALAPAGHPQQQRLDAIARRIIPYTAQCNPRAREWQWQVSLIGSKELNAFCMPGGKIAFYYGILQQLQLSDDEVAVVMGHEISHALLEHARERVGKTTLTQGALEIGSALLGLGQLGRTVAGYGGQLLTLTFSRQDESEADHVGLELAALAGYDPRAGVTLWQKMLSANKGAPPEWLSTHPSGENRIRAIEAQMPRVEPIYARAERPPQRFAPPALAKS
jgi:predicted Zn-dependent protease